MQGRNKGCQSTHVVYDLPRLLIPQGWHTVSSLVVLVILEVNFMKVLAAKQFVHRSSRILVISLWELPAWPSFVVALRVWLDNGDVNDIRQTADMSDQIGAMCERTKETWFDFILRFVLVIW